MAPWQTAADMCLDTATAEDVLACSTTLDLHGIFAAAVTREVGMYVARRRWIYVEVVADGALLVVGCGVGKCVDVQRDGVVCEEVQDLEVW